MMKNKFLFAFPVLILALIVYKGAAKEFQTGYFLQHEKEIARDEPGLHEGLGKTTSHSFFADVKESKLVFRKRILHPGSAQKKLHHFVFFAHERERIHEKSFLSNKNIEGAQLKYFWRELEPEEGIYDFTTIEKDLKFLRSKGKKLFIQVQDVTFDTQYKAVPRYLRTPKYHDGVVIQYRLNDDEQVVRQQGWMAKRWDTLVSNRFFKLLKLLGQQYDGRIAGINLDETSIEVGFSGKHWPQGFTPEIYKEAIENYMRELKKYFKKSVAMAFVNFMPGESLPQNDKGYIKDLYNFASINSIAMGGPDIKVYKPFQMVNSYALLKKYSNRMITGLAVQDGNLAEINPKTGNQVTVKEVFDFAKDYLNLDYIFWGTEEPYYSNEVLPFLKKFPI